MRIAKLSKAIEAKDIQSMLIALDNDVEKLYQVLAGRVRLGSGVDGERGENVLGVFQQFTTHATPNTEFSVSHGCATIPIGFQILWQSIAGSLYQGPTTGTAWSDSLAHFKCSVASVTISGFFYK